MTQHTEPNFWEDMRRTARAIAERKAAEEGALPPWPTKRSGKPVKRAVCGDCGYVVSHFQSAVGAAPRCPKPDHRAALLYEWKNAHVVGLHLLHKAYERGEDLERWVEDADETLELKGTDRLTVSWLLSMALTHWGLFIGPSPVRAETTFNPLFQERPKP